MTSTVDVPPATDAPAEQTICVWPHELTAHALPSTRTNCSVVPKLVPLMVSATPLVGGAIGSTEPIVGAWYESVVSSAA